MAVAMDAQGPARPRPYVQKAQATFPCLIDEENRLGQLLSFKAIPNGLLIDEKGILQYKKFGGFDIQKPETRQIVEAWLSDSSVGDAESTGRTELDGNVLALFDEGLAAYRADDVESARAKWREASVLDPLNYVIHKQLWAIENPERFYGDRVDMAWQKEQLAQGLTEMIRIPVIIHF